MKKVWLALFAVLAAELSAFTPYDGYKCAFVRELEAGHKQTIVCYGTSLTAGHYVQNPPGPPQFLQNALDARYPGLATVINSGKAGNSSVWGVQSANIKEKVLDYTPDAVFIEFAINDAVLNSTYNPATQTYTTSEMAGVSCSLETSLANIKSIVSQIKTALQNCEIILMTMNDVGDNNGTNNEVRHPNLEAYYNDRHSLTEEGRSDDGATTFMIFKLAAAILSARFVTTRSLKSEPFVRLDKTSLKTSPPRTFMTASRLASSSMSR